LKELVEDLTGMGCEGLLAKPCNLQSEATLRKFLFERGNQWFKEPSGMIRRNGWLRFGRRFTGLFPGRAKCGTTVKIISM
jgi:hypothetical protein